MDGAAQTVYPRKNWSSLMVFNCDHPTVRRLTPDLVNRETGAYLHRMQWLADEEIGALPVEWNWLEGWNEKPAHGTPNAVHFTRGGPWFENWQNVEYGDLWRAERETMSGAAVTYGMAGTSQRMTLPRPTIFIGMAASARQFDCIEKYCGGSLTMRVALNCSEIACFQQGDLKQAAASLQRAFALRAGSCQHQL